MAAVDICSSFFSSANFNTFECPQIGKHSHTFISELKLQLLEKKLKFALFLFLFSDVIFPMARKFKIEQSIFSYSLLR